MTTKAPQHKATGTGNLAVTEGSRREQLAQLEDERDWRIVLEAIYGQVWDTEELKRDFNVIGFLAPIVAVHRKDNGEEGTLEFLDQPRLYFNYRSSSPRS